MYKRQVTRNEHHQRLTIEARGGIVDTEQQLLVGALCVAAATSILVAAVAARRMVAVITVAQARRADVIVDLRDQQRKAVEDLIAMERSRT